MDVEGRPVGYGVAGPAHPKCEPTAAVSEAGDVTNQNSIGAEAVPIRAMCGRLCHPRAVSRSD